MVDKRDQGIGWNMKLNNYFKWGIKIFGEESECKIRPRDRERERKRKVKILSKAILSIKGI